MLEKYVAEKYDLALNIYMDTLQIDNQLGDLTGKASDLNNIGKIYEIQGNIDKSLKNYEETFEVFNQLGQKQYVEIYKEKIEQLKDRLRE